MLGGTRENVSTAKLPYPAKLPLEETDGAAPGQLGCFLVVALGRGVVVEGVMRAVIALVSDRLAGGAERSHPWEQGLRDARVGSCMVDQERRLDLGSFGGIRGGAVIDHSRAKIVAGRWRSSEAPITCGWQRKL